MSPFLWFFYGVLSSYGAYLVCHIVKTRRENARLREQLRERILQSTEAFAPDSARINTLDASQINTGQIVLRNAFSGFTHFADGSTVLSVDVERAAAVQRYVAALARSRELLLRFLDMEQEKQLQDGNSFVTTSPSGRKWEIRQGGIDLLDDNGDRIRSYCYLADEAEGLPVYDQMLARKLMVEHHEEQVLRDGVVTYDRDAANYYPSEARLQLWSEQCLRMRQLERESADYRLETLPNGARIITPSRQ